MQHVIRFSPRFCTAQFQKLIVLQKLLPELLTNSVPWSVPQIIRGHETMTIAELTKLYIQFAKEEEKIDLGGYHRYRLKDRLVARYRGQIKFVNVKHGYPQVVVNASDHAVQPDVLNEIKWNERDVEEFTLADPAGEGLEKNSAEEPGSIHAYSDTGDDFSPSSPTAPATQSSGRDCGASCASLELEAEEMATGDEPCHLTVNQAVYDRWCSIRTAEGLETDTDLAQLFIRQYEETKTHLASPSVCVGCGASLQFCPVCESLALVASEGQQLPTQRQEIMQTDPVVRGQGRPRTRRGDADRGAESDRGVGVSVAGRVRDRPQKREAGDDRAETSAKIFAQSVGFHSDESDFGEFGAGDMNEDDSNIGMICNSKRLPDEEEVAEPYGELEGTGSFGTHIDQHVEVSVLASGPERGDYFQSKEDGAVRPVQDNSLWLMEENSAHFNPLRHTTPAQLRRGCCVAKRVKGENFLQFMGDNSPLSVEDSCALSISKENNSALSKEGNLGCMEDNFVQSKGNSTTKDRRDGYMQCEEAHYKSIDGSTVRSATCSDQHQPLKGVHVDLCLLQPSPSFSFPQRKTRSSSCVPACYSVPQQEAVKSAAENGKQKKKTKNKCDSDSDSDWDPSEPSHRKNKKNRAAHHACKFCLQIFRTLQEFKKHLDTHKLQTKCDHCDSVFDDKTSYFEHVKQHKGGMPFSCDLCSLCFMSSEDRDRHKEAHTCRKCGKVYKSLQALKSHMQCHINGENPFKCDSCGKGFFFEVTLRRHLSACGNRERRYICEICAKAFKNGTTLRAHIKTHSDEKPFACTLCSARLKSKKSLNVHMKGHRGEKPYVCEQCGRAFLEASKLRNHKLRVHCKERPHQCHLCGYACAVWAGLRMHLHRRHSYEKPFKCEYCPLVFRDRPDLVSHTRTHTGEKPYSCKLCNATFARSDYLSKHRAIHTGNTPFMCSLCGVGFRHSVGLKRHSGSCCKARV